MVEIGRNEGNILHDYDRIDDINHYFLIKVQKLIDSEILAKTPTIEDSILAQSIIKAISCLYLFNGSLNIAFTK